MICITEHAFNIVIHQLHNDK